MDLEDLIEALVEERSTEALETLLGSKAEVVLEALMNAAGQVLKAEVQEDADDQIVEEIRGHLVESKAMAILSEALQSSEPTTREFALSCMSEIGDTGAAAAMVNLLEHKDAATREAAAEHLALLTHYDYGQDVAKWREYVERRAKGVVEQQVEDQEDAQRRLRLQIRGKRGPDKDKGDRDDNADDDDDDRGGRRLDDDDDDDRGSSSSSSSSARPRSSPWGSSAGSGRLVDDDDDDDRGKRSRDDDDD